MLRRLATVLALAFVIPASAHAAGGNYTFQGASATERSTVRAALNASSFDWNVVPNQITLACRQVRRVPLDPGAASGSIAASSPPGGSATGRP